MPVEIERKFLVRGDSWRRSAGAGVLIRQGYVSKNGRGSVRVRRAGDSATVAIKGRRAGISRHEFEFPISAEDEKVRYAVPMGGLTWEVDVYGGDAAGLVLAEVELQGENQLFELPDWIGAEVTHDLRYRSSAIAAGEWRGGEGPRARPSDQVELRQ